MSESHDVKDEILKKLDLLLIVLLAEKGIPQKSIAKILGISNVTIIKNFGKNYEKLLPKIPSNNKNQKMKA